MQQGATKWNRLQEATRCSRVLKRATKYKKVQQVSPRFKKCNMVLKGAQRVTKSYKMM